MIWKYVSIFLAGAVLAVFTTLALTKAEPVVIPEQPDCNCPAVSVQPFEVDKIKGLKTFNYTPQFNGSIAVGGVDSTSVQRWIAQSVDNAFVKYVQSKNKSK